MRCITSRPAAVEQAHDVHALGVAEAGVELDHLDAVGGREEAAVHHAAEMPPFAGEARDHALDDRARLLVVRAVMNGSVAPAIDSEPMPPVPGPSSPS